MVQPLTKTIKAVTVLVLVLFQVIALNGFETAFGDCQVDVSTNKGGSGIGNTNGGTYTVGELITINIELSCDSTVAVLTIYKPDGTSVVERRENKPAGTYSISNSASSPGRRRVVIEAYWSGSSSSSYDELYFDVAEQTRSPTTPSTTQTSLTICGFVDDVDRDGILELVVCSTAVQYKFPNAPNALELRYAVLVNSVISGNTIISFESYRIIQDCSECSQTPPQTTTPPRNCQVDVYTDKGGQGIGNPNGGTYRVGETITIHIELSCDSTLATLTIYKPDGAPVVERRENKPAGTYQISNTASTPGRRRVVVEVYWSGSSSPSYDELYFDVVEIPTPTPTTPIPAPTPTQTPIPTPTTPQPTTPSEERKKQIPLTLIQQETDESCWAATSVMLLTYYGTYDSVILSAPKPQLEFARELGVGGEYYYYHGIFAEIETLSGRWLGTLHRLGKLRGSYEWNMYMVKGVKQYRLDFGQVINEINSNNPVMVCTDTHCLIISGYIDREGTDRDEVIVHDSLQPKIYSMSFGFFLTQIALVFHTEYDVREGTSLTLQESSHKLYLHVYDSQGRHVGIDYRTNVMEMGIPNAQYFDYNYSILINLPSEITDFRYVVDAKYAQQSQENYDVFLSSIRNKSLVSEDRKTDAIEKGETKEYTARISSGGEIVKPWGQTLTLTIGFAFIAIVSVGVVYAMRNKRTQGPRIKSVISSRPMIKSISSTKMEGPRIKSVMDTKEDRSE